MALKDIGPVEFTPEFSKGSSFEIPVIDYLA